jgi:hypothetical protein
MSGCATAAVVVESELPYAVGVTQSLGLFRSFLDSSSSRSSHAAEHATAV